MSRTAIRYVKWKIFFDGVEVPWIDFSVQTGVDSPGEATISLPPDPMLIHQRARTKVHIFMFDEFETGVEAVTKSSDEKAYKLYWEGEVDSIADSETPIARQFVVSAKGIMDGLSRANAYMLGLGAIGASPLITGSSLLWNDGVKSRTLLALSNLSSSFDVDNSTYMSDSYAERAIRLISYLASHNAWLRLHAVRTGLIGKIAGISDKTLTHLIPRVLASPYFRQVGDGVDQDKSALDILSRFNNAVFHHFSSVALPRFVGEVPKHLSKVPPLGDDEDRYALTKVFARNDYLILPETYYAIPPACNLIFPEMNTSFSVQRSFRNEPTRSVVVDGQLGTNVVVVAPDDLFRYDKKPNKDMRPEEVWGVNWAQVAGDPATSPYVSPSGTNLFTALTDLEIERGVNPLMSVPPFQVFSAMVNRFDLKTGDSSARQKMSSALKPLGELFLDLQSQSRVESDDSTGQSYIYVMKALADYNLTLTRYTRQTSMSMLGHRWLVPGFPAVILRKGGSYAAYVTTHRFSVDANGQETSAVNLDYVRPLPVTDYAGASVLVALSSSISAVKDAARKVRVVYDALKTELVGAYGAMMAAYADVRRLSSAYGTEGYRVYLLKYGDARAAYISLLGPILDSEEPLYSAEFRAIPFAEDPSDLRDAHTRTVASIDKARDSVKMDEAESVAASPAFGDTRIAGALRNLKEAITECGAVISSNTKLRQVFAFPPLFANSDLIRKETAEKLYGDLLGTAPVFTKAGESDTFFVTGELEGVAGNLEIAYQNEKAYSDYLSFLKSLARIFPLGKETNTAWDERTKSGDMVESVRDWEERDILRRTGLHSLGAFATTHKLDLVSESSDRPNVDYFYVLRPVKAREIMNSEHKKLWWDNTLFSCIVDEKEFAGETADPELQRLRESVTDEFLTTKVRQEYWIAYSRKHWGSRAHDLS